MKTLDAYTPRRPLDDHLPDGYRESDKDYVLNNIELAVKLLDSCSGPHLSLNQEDLRDKLADDATHAAMTACAALTRDLTEDEQGQMRDQLNDAIHTVLGEFIDFAK